MTLIQLLEALANNKGLYISLLDDSDKELIRFNAEGYEVIEGDLSDRVVKRVKVASLNLLEVSIEDAP